MQIDAIYDHGHLEFSRPVQFKHERVRIVVEVPDDEVIAEGNPYNLPQEVLDQADQLRKRLDDARNAPVPPDDELPPLSEKSIERMKAISMREDR